MFILLYHILHICVYFFSIAPKKYEKKAKQREKLISEKEDKFRGANEIKLYVQKMIETKNLVTEWDDTLWVIFLDSAIVNTDGTIEFGFKDGSKISV